MAHDTEASLQLQAGDVLREHEQPVTPQNISRLLAAHRTILTEAREAQQRTENFIAGCRRGARAAAPRQPATLPGAVAALNAAADKLPTPTLAQEVERELAKPEHAGKYVAYVNEKSGDVHAFAVPVPYDKKTKK